MTLKRFYSTAAAVIMAIFLIMVSACTTAASTFTVTFDYNDGVTLSTTVEVESGDAVQKPDDPQRTGYTFEYWYADDQGEAYSFSTPVTSNLTLRAKWSAIEYVVTVYLYDGNTYEEKVGYGEQFKEPDEPQREGYEFTGWFKDQACMNAFDFSSAIYANTAVYAGWMNTAATYYYVTYNYNYTGAPQSAVASVEENAQALVPEEPVRGGYEFAGWYTTSDCVTAYDFETPVTGDIEIFAGWKEIEGEKNYKFEAELTDFSNLSGTGYSNEAKGPTMIQRDTSGNAQASNGFWIGYLYLQGCSLTFEIYSETSVSDATLKLRLSGEIVNAFILNSDDFTVELNGKKINYVDMLIDNIPTGVGSEVRKFEDYTVGENLTLNSGWNTVTLTVTNNKPLTGTNGNAAGGKIAATAPLVDCIKISTSAVLSWTPYPDLLTQRFDWWNFDTDYEGIIDD